MKCLALALLLLILSPLALADSVRYLKRPAPALALYLDQIRSAKSTIDITTFIFEPCHASTQVVMDALVERVRAGVRVRVLLDAFMQSDSQRAQIATFFRRSGIELRWYNRTFKFNPVGNYRSHAKLLVVDGARYFSGGRNLADDYFGLYRGMNFTDSDVAVEGPSARDAAASFQELWGAMLTSPAKEADVPFRNWAQACNVDESERVKMIKAFLEKSSASLIASAPARTCGEVTFFNDSPEFTRPDLGGGLDPRWDFYMTPARLKLKRVTNTFLNFLRGTRHGVELENWAYMPTNYMGAELDYMRSQRIPAHVISNADMDGSDTIRHAEEYVNNKFAKLHNTGSQTVILISMHGALNDSFALTPPTARFRLHSKVAVRDGKDVLVGSFNIDPRSYATNIETLVQVENCPALAKDLQSEFDRLRKIYIEDVKSGKIPPPESPSFLGKVLAIVGITFL